MIFCLFALFAAIIYGLLIASHPVLAWHLVGLIAIGGGIFAGYEHRKNGL